jgi:hypothetical protein
MQVLEYAPKTGKAHQLANILTYKFRASLQTSDTFLLVNIIAPSEGIIFLWWRLYATMKQRAGYANSRVATTFAIQVEAKLPFEGESTAIMKEHF